MWAERLKDEPRYEGALGDLRNEVRENLLAFLRDEYPGALPRHRADLIVRESDQTPSAPATEIDTSRKTGLPGS